MNCRRFESLASDWAASKLSDELSAQMKRHRDICASCARLMQSELQLRRAWKSQMETMPTGPDLWVRVSSRLEPRRRQILPAPRLAWSGAAALIVAAAVLAPSAIRPHEHTDLAGSQSGKAPVAQHTIRTAPSETLASLPSLSDVASPSPIVDDPAGTSMEDIWTHIKSENN